MNNIDGKILSLWKSLSEREKKEVLLKLHEKLSLRLHIEVKERELYAW